MNIISFLICILCCFNFSFGQNNLVSEKKDKSPLPGFYQTLNRLNFLQKDSLRDLQKSVRKQKFLTLEDLKKFKSVKIHPLLLLYILKNSSSNYLKLYRQDLCSFISLLDNNLLNTLDRRLDFIIVEAVNKKEEKENYFVEKRIFVDFIYLNRCIENREVRDSFKLEHLKQSIKKVNLRVPESQSSCLELLEEHIASPNTAYLCRYAHMLKNSSSGKKNSNEFQNIALKIKKELNEFQQLYISNLCNNLENPNYFCQNYLEQSIWRKVITGESPHSWMTYRCQKTFNPPQIIEKINRTQLEECRNHLINKDSSCAYLTSDLYSSLSPAPFCKSTSSALFSSHLNGEYQDCPGNIQRSDLSLVQRLMAHEYKLKRSNNSENCSFDAQELTFTALKKSDLQELWKSQICYFDKIDKNERCNVFAMSSLQGEFSLSGQIKKILERTRNIAVNQDCPIVEEKNYRPQLLQFKQGCFAIFNRERCWSFQCPMRIFNNGSEVFNISIQEKGDLSLLPYKSSETNNFLANVLEKALNNKKLISIQSLTELQNHLKNQKNLAWGIGCAEDLYPHFFHQSAMNSCRAVSFIIDSISKEDGKFFVTLRSSLDEVNSPRIIGWNYVFNSLKRYQTLHPLNTWNLYAYIEN